MGNVYRSRFAEAYAKSKNKEHEFSSSGVAADGYFGPVTWWGMKLAYDYKIDRLMKPNHDWFDEQNLDDIDLVVFMNPEVEKAAKERVNLSGVEYETWDIDDLFPTEASGIDLDVKIINQSNNTAKKITKNVDQLLQRL